VNNGYAMLIDPPCTKWAKSPNWRVNLRTATISQPTCICKESSFRNSWTRPMSTRLSIGVRSMG
jgi:hypothetical protein